MLYTNFISQSNTLCIMYGLYVIIYIYSQLTSTLSPTWYFCLRRVETIVADVAVCS